MLIIRYLSAYFLNEWNEKNPLCIYQKALLLHDKVIKFSDKYLCYHLQETKPSSSGFLAFGLFFHTHCYLSLLELHLKPQLNILLMVALEVLA